MSYATRYQQQVSFGSACPLCGGSIMGGEWCGHCFAPAEVIDSIEARDEMPHFIGVLGPSGVGKTVYLGILLDLLAREACGLHGMGRGPFSLTLHRNLMLALERQRFPEKTPAEPDRWQWVHCEVSSRRKGSLFDIVTPDVAGEAVLGEIENPGSRPTVRALIQQCSGLVVLIDILQVVADGQSQELFAMQLITYLDSMRSSKRRKVELPVALVFTKADLCDEPIEDPNEFARANAPALWRLCEARLKRFQFFCSGVAGSCAHLIDEDGYESLVPLRVEPKGVVDPFAWMVTQIR